jgi:hypothetical protein
LAESSLIILSGPWIGSRINSSRILYSQLRKIPEQELEETLNRALFNFEKFWKQKLLGFETRSRIKLDKILEMQNPERSFQAFSRNDQD